MCGTTDSLKLTQYTA